MDHQTFLANLPPATKTALTMRSDTAGLRHLAGHFTAIVLCAALIVSGIPGWWLLVPVQGVLISFLFTLEHETTHKTPFAHERLNEWVGRICGFVLLLPLEWFRYFHLAHHRWTNIEGRDPELEGGSPETLAAWAWHVSGLPYWRARISLLWSLSRGTEHAAYLPAPALPRIEREARMMVAGYALCVASLAVSPLLFWIWFLPALIGQPALRLYLLSEHGDCPRVANMFANTRTTFTNRIIRFLAWNMPYHTEHHVYPAVPFHHLPDLHHLIRDHLQVTADGYAAFTAEYLTRRR